VIKKPYTAGELITIAITVPIPPLDPARVIATYADPGNWTSVHQNQRHYWAWAGPVIVGYALAQWPIDDYDTALVPTEESR
jgi:hypothetical protein